MITVAVLVLVRFAATLEFRGVCSGDDLFHDDDLRFRIAAIAVISNIEPPSQPATSTEP